MERWKISEAKAKLTALLTSCIKEPQIICNREKPVAAVINVKLFEELMQIKKEKKRPVIGIVPLQKWKACRDNRVGEPD